MEDKIDKFISKIEAKKRKKAIVKDKEIEKRYIKNQKLLKLEKEKHQEKIELLNKILDWAKEFSKSPRFKKIMKIRNCYNDLIIFYSNYGHVGDYEENRYPGRWARICIDKKENLEYTWGYKWTGMQHFYLNKKNIKKIKYTFLKDLWKSIDSGKIFDTIENELKSMYN